MEGRFRRNTLSLSVSSCVLLFLNLHSVTLCACVYEVCKTLLYRTSLFHVALSSYGCKALEFKPFFQNYYAGKSEKNLLGQGNLFILEIWNIRRCLKNIRRRNLQYLTIIP